MVHRDPSAAKRGVRRSRISNRPIAGVTHCAVTPFPSRFQRGGGRGRLGFGLPRGAKPNNSPLSHGVAPKARGSREGAEGRRGRRRRRRLRRVAALHRNQVIVLEHRYFRRGPDRGGTRGWLGVCGCGGRRRQLREFVVAQNRLRLRPGRRSDGGGRSWTRQGGGRRARGMSSRRKRHHRRWGCAGTRRRWTRRVPHRLEGGFPVKPRGGAVASRIAGGGCDKGTNGGTGDAARRVGAWPTGPGEEAGVLGSGGIPRGMNSSGTECRSGGASGTAGAGARGEGATTGGAVIGGFTKLGRPGGGARGAGRSPWKEGGGGNGWGAVDGTGSLRLGPVPAVAPRGLGTGPTGVSLIAQGAGGGGGRGACGATGGGGGTAMGAGGWARANEPTNTGGGGASATGNPGGSAGRIGGGGGRSGGGANGAGGGWLETGWGRWDERRQRRGDDRGLGPKDGRGRSQNRRSRRRRRARAIGA